MKAQAFSKLIRHPKHKKLSSSLRQNLEPWVFQVAEMEKEPSDLDIKITE